MYQNFSPLTLYFSLSFSPFNLFEQRYANESVKFHIPFDLVSIGGSSIFFLNRKFNWCESRIKNIFRPISKINGYVYKLRLCFYCSRIQEVGVQIINPPWTIKGPTFYVYFYKQNTSNGHLLYRPSLPPVMQKCEWEF